MNRLSIFSHTMLWVLVAGCTKSPEMTDPGSTTGDPSTGEAPTSGTSATVEAPTGSSGESPAPDAGSGDAQCDPWMQDCPAGYKCMACAEEGEPAFTGTKCTPVVAEPKVAGDPCHVEDGWWTGFDDCDYGLACWDINHETNAGRCVSLCTGSADAYDCPSAEDICVFWVPGLAHVCLETCDPLIQDCDPGQTCLPDWASNADEWVCYAEYSFDEGQEFDPCSFSNVCDPGLMCWDPTKAIECAGAQDGCCLSLCDLGAPLCNGDGAECTSFYDVLEGEAPPEFSEVGICILPG